MTTTCLIGVAVLALRYCEAGTVFGTGTSWGLEFALAREMVLTVRAPAAATAVVKIARVRPRRRQRLLVVPTIRASPIVFPPSPSIMCTTWTQPEERLTVSGHAEQWPNEAASRPPQYDVQPNSRPRKALFIPQRQLGEQCAPEAVGAVPNTRQRGKVAAAERADLVGQRLVDQPCLHLLELPLDVLLVTGEDQAHVEIANPIHAPVVVPATPQDAAGSRL